MYRKGQTITATLSDLADGDKCYAKLPDGMSVFIRGTLAIGDTVEATIYKAKKSYLEAQFTQLLSPSPLRTEPKCEVFGICGGCKWQHLDYNAQLQQKNKHVLDTLTHIGGFRNITMLEPIGATRLYHYRNKVDFSLSTSRYLLPNEMNAPQKRTDFAIGFHAPQRYDKVIDIEQCHIAPEEANLVLNTVRNFALKQSLTIYNTHTHEGYLRNLVVRKAFRTQELMVNLVTSWHDAALMQHLLNALQTTLGTRLTTFVNNISTKKNTVAFGEEEHLIFGKGFITEKLGEYAFNISANSFFQTNTEQAERLYEITRDFAELNGSETVYDLYCGTGSISIFISRHCKQVFGIELVESAVQDAIANAERNRVRNCTFKMLDLMKFESIQSELRAFGLPDVIVTDPPRSGMHPKAVQTMLNFAPKKIVYVSCNPASLARDSKLICESGKYRLVKVQAVDMFPHTNHIESVALFEIVNSNSQ
jgi:23S rRNA (uracil1939-C5)-methyltransferase